MSWFNGSLAEPWVLVNISIIQVVLGPSVSTLLTAPGLLTWSEIWCDVENSKSLRSSRDCRIFQVTDSRVHRLYIISLHLFSLLRA
jgi:hypothetical protein